MAWVDHAAEGQKPGTTTSTWGLGPGACYAQIGAGIETARRAPLALTGGPLLTGTQPPADMKAEMAVAAGSRSTQLVVTS